MGPPSELMAVVQINPRGIDPMLLQAECAALLKVIKQTCQAAGI
jgi:hypothetical protein